MLVLPLYKAGPCLSADATDASCCQFSDDRFQHLGGRVDREIAAGFRRWLHCTMASKVGSTWVVFF